MNGPSSIDREAVKRANRLEDVLPPLTGLALHGVNGRGEPTILCPWHDDAHPSLRLNLDKQLWHCDPCATGGDVFTFVERYQQTDFAGALRWLAERAGLRSQPPRIVATFDYHDAEGHLVYQSYRVEPGPGGKRKTFKLRRPDGGGGWIDNMAGVTRVPYRLAELKGKEAVIVVEGERKADCLWDVKLPATCNAGGAGKWQEAFAPTLRALGASRVAVLPDNDDPGRAHADQVAHACHAAGLQVKVVTLPDLPAKGDILDWFKAGHTRDELIALVKGAALYTPASLPRLVADAGVEVDHILRALVTFIRRFVVVTDHQATAIALWAAHTHAIEAFDCTPYLQVTSATKRAGKTRLLEVLEPLVARPWFTGRTSAAALVRKVDAECPTLLLDESDAAFGGEKEYAEALRGQLNTGYRRSGKSTVCIGQGAKIEARDFCTFSPKAIAGIGKLPDTVADRSVAIQLRRRLTDEPCERWRERDGHQQASGLREALASALTASIEALRAARPELPHTLGDRQADVWEPLLAIADLAGGTWPEVARQAAAVLAGTVEDADVTVELLRDVRDVLTDYPPHKDIIPTVYFIEQLVGNAERPWATWRKGDKPITPRGLARLLDPLDIHVGQFKVDGSNVRGYRREAFTDAIARYLPMHVGLRDGTNKLGPESRFSSGTDESASPACEEPKTPLNTGSVPLPHIQTGTSSQAGDFIPGLYTGVPKIEAIATCEECEPTN